MRLYCIEHQEMADAVPLDFCPFGHEHYSEAKYDGVVVIELDFCCFEGGYAMVPPPEEFFLVGHEYVPTPDELEELNQSSAELLTSWT